MRRIDRIRAMSVYEMADALMATDVIDNINACPSRSECNQALDKNEKVLEEKCRKCLIEWLKEDPHEQKQK